MAVAAAPRARAATHRESSSAAEAVAAALQRAYPPRAASNLSSASGRRERGAGGGRHPAVTAVRRKAPQWSGGCRLAGRLVSCGGTETASMVITRISGS